MTSLHEEIAPNLHPLLGAALEALAEDQRPGAPYHLDGPRPKLSVQGIAEAAELCAAHARPHARGDGAECDRLLGLLRSAVLDEGPPDAAWRIDLRGARTIREHARGALKVIALACEAAYEDPLRALDRLSTAIALTMRMLDATKRHAFVAELDRRIVLSEAEELARRAAHRGRVLVAHEDGLASWLVRQPSGRWAASTGAIDALRPAPAVATQRRVAHPRFGEGQVARRDPGPSSKLEVRFAHGTKWPLEARLTPIA